MEREKVLYYNYLHFTCFGMLPIHAVLFKPLEAGGGVAGEGDVGEVHLLDVVERLVPLLGVGLIEGAGGCGAQPVVGRLRVLVQEPVDHNLILSDRNHKRTFGSGSFSTSVLLQSGSVLDGLGPLNLTLDQLSIILDGLRTR